VKISSWHPIHVMAGKELIGDTTESLAQPALLAPSAPGLETILLIHGTFANSSDKEEGDWWTPGSDFCRDLDEKLRTRGSAARCWEHLNRTSRAKVTRDPSRRLPFAWCGENSEKARREAGRALAGRLRALEQDPRIVRYHLVGHSHGGNVILNALDELTTRPQKLGQVITLGTPVLYFRHWESLDYRWISIPIYSALVWACAWACRNWPGYEWMACLAAAIVIITMGGELIRSRSRTTRRHPHYYGSGRASAFVFANQEVERKDQGVTSASPGGADGNVVDEAIAGLLAAQQITRQPGKFIRQFMQPKRLSDFAVPVTEPPPVDYRSQIKETVAYRLLRSIQASRPQTLALSAATVTEESGELALEKEPSLLRTLLDAAATLLPFRSFAIVVLWVCATLPFLVLKVSMGLCSAIAKVTGRLVACGFVRGTHYLGRISLPFLVRKAVFGADSGTFVRVTTHPPGVDSLEPISDELLRKAIAISAKLSDQTSQALRTVISSADVFAVKSRIVQAFANPTLAHSFYYQSTEIRERIVQLIDSVQQEDREEPPVRRGNPLAPSWLVRSRAA